MNGAAAAAAAAAKRAAEEEEEQLTPYSDRDLAEGWEFKIVRSSTGAFRNPAVLRKTLDEEKAAGWELVEKFDNARIRLKRPLSARADDSKHFLDPYRTRIGPSDLKIVLLVMGAILGAVAVLIIALYSAGHR